MKGFIRRDARNERHQARRKEVSLVWKLDVNFLVMVVLKG